MSYPTGSTAGAAAASAAMAQATKALGAIVRLEPNQFQKILNRIDEPLVVTARGGWLNRKYKYLTSYRGLFFYTVSETPIQETNKTEFITAKNIWVPS